MRPSEVNSQFYCLQVNTSIKVSCYIDTHASTKNSYFPEPRIRQKQEACLGYIFAV